MEFALALRSDVRVTIWQIGEIGRNHEGHHLGSAHRRWPAWWPDARIGNVHVDEVQSFGDIMWQPLLTARIPLLACASAHALRLQGFLAAANAATDAGSIRTPSCVLSTRNRPSRMRRYTYGAVTSS